MAYCFRNHYDYRKENGRHDEDLDHVPEYKKELDDFVDDARTVIFIGWRYDDPIAYNSFDYLCKFAKVTLIEAFQKNCDDFHEHNINKYPVEVICDDAIHFIKTTNRQFDLCIWQDGPEHVKYENFIEFLNYAFSKIDRLIISTPNGEFPQHDLYGNPWECHLSTWYDYNYENLGFKTAKYLADTKDTMDPLHKQSALMGFRYLKYPYSSKKPNLYVYPNAKIQSHDKINEYWNTVPMTIEGRHKHFNIITDPKKADAFFMGMISCGTVQDFNPEDFPFLEEYENRHIFELEGDWVSNHAPAWLSKLVKSGNSSKPEHLIGPLFVRPAVSNFLAYLAKDNPEYELEFPPEKTWGFRGFPDPFGVRSKTIEVMSQLKLPGNYTLTDKFGARQSLQSNHVRDYYGLLYNNLISVCPRGAGIDSIRFYETCFFGRVPIAISDAKWLSEDYYDMSFAIRLSPSLTREQLATEFIKINNIPYEDLIERGRLSYKYFQEVVVPYFKDPTKEFIKYLYRHNLVL